MSIGALSHPEFHDPVAGKLPRHYPFLKDPAFWVLAVVDVPYLVYLLLIVYQLWRQGPWTWPVFVVAALGILHPSCVFWVAADTYRWQVPNRLLYIAFCFFSASLFWGYYATKVRPEWLMHVEQERHRLANLPQRERELAALAEAMRTRD